MTTEDDARRVVDTELDRLHERFGAFDVTETAVENDPGFYEHGLDHVRRTGMLADAGALVRDRRDRTLLVRHPAAPETWTTPGGGYEAGDGSLVATAIREVREETAVRCTIMDIRSARIKTIEHRDEQRSYQMLTVAFVARGEGLASAAGDEEILEAQWFADPPDEFGNND
ncbi:NUDIX hydrolase [Halococcus qingdaonensis]|uniref:NUDIX hydrolase n=1 Tax=Halococcus qingdaonensis TaxID=224402 RepID=UPI002115E890|nr:NUDIX hydrolase [Halococcus qingdaonensis]